MVQVSKINNLYSHDLQCLYLDYMNNFLTVDRFAEYYSISVEDANLVIEKGELAHAEYIFNKANRLN